MFCKYIFKNFTFTIYCVYERERKRKEGKRVETVHTHKPR